MGRYNNKTKNYKKILHTHILLYEISYNLQMLNEQNAVIYNNELRVCMSL